MAVQLMAPKRRQEVVKERLVLAIIPCLMKVGAMLGDRGNEHRLGKSGRVNGRAGTHEVTQSWRDNR